MEQEGNRGRVLPLGDDCYHLRKNSKVLNQGCMEEIEKIKKEASERCPEGRTSGFVESSQSKSKAICSYSSYSILLPIEFPVSFVASF